MLTTKVRAALVVSATVAASVGVSATATAVDYDAEAGNEEAKLSVSELKSITGMKTTELEDLSSLLGAHGVSDLNGVLSLNDLTAFTSAAGLGDVSELAELDVPNASDIKTAAADTTSADASSDLDAVLRGGALSGILAGGLMPDSINVGNDLCALPWYWQGPINAFLGSQDGHYQACNGASSSSEYTEGINVGNDLCALPWYWQGPINTLIGDQDGFYAACNE